VFAVGTFLICCDSVTVPVTTVPRELGRADFHLDDLRISRQQVQVWQLNSNSVALKTLGRNACVVEHANGVIATVEQDEVIAVKEGDRVRLVAKSRPLFVKRVTAPNAPNASGHDEKPKVDAGTGNVAAAADDDDGDGDDGDDDDDGGVVSGDAAAGEPQREPGSGSDLLEPANEVAATRKAKAGDSGNITVFKCPLCDVVSENNIDVHMKKMHPACQLSPIKTTAVASFRCHKCPARFFLKAAGLTRHLVLQHGEKVKALPKRVKKAAPPKGGDHDDDADDRPPSKRRRKPAAAAAVSSTARAPVVPTPAVPSPPVQESVRGTAPRPPETRPVAVAYGDLDPLMPSLFSAARSAAPPPRHFVQIVTFSSPDFDKQ